MFGIMWPIDFRHYEIMPNIDRPHNIEHCQALTNIDLVCSAL